MKKIGILGGTFDPIHKGHIYIANMAIKKCNLHKVYFMPLSVPPHKKMPIATSNQRMDLIKNVIKDNNMFDVLDIEINRQGTTYTIDTLKKLKTLFSEQEIFYIIGSDTLLDLQNWKDIKNVCKLCTFICVVRKIDDDDLKCKEKMEKDFDAKIIFVNCLPYVASSSQIKSKEDISLVPEQIKEQVKKIYFEGKKIID